ncbi:major facilitator superfamily MFS_1 [Brachyspira pilosicoli WesB]|uniref:Major facilitator superfamily MFS_1 n=3 Tax=Brachyspira pilosicoli TaxID=52584 RepID=K0JN45_BRAPL|nr:MFS transporter [Brachyspira pilosicoli]AFR71889.1 major facilitator superfamily MFS_1 [Brachyspira pilosicoli B2904]MBW5391540.1 MFS transporter [Brachyspira pilosicoli]PLV55172.1 MFS transporter [Brachyspira pilosicoli SP16]WIH80853.1 MFS transporter [Brachyspira pilosicoli]WIH83060.1 MFS transporter [Brachyspira pilosicoli]
MILLVYSMPFLVYLCSSIFSTVLVINSSEMGASAFFISLLAVFYGMGMMVSASTFSKFKIPKRIYPKLLYIQSCIQALLSILCVIYLNNELSLLYSFLYGSNTTIFFVCFQSLLDSVSKDLPVRISSGLFIFSWTLGLSVGPIVTGFVYNFSSDIGFFIVIAMSVLMFILFYLSRHLHFKPKRHKWEEPFMRAPRYKVYIGWLIIFVGALVLHTLRFMFLDYGIKEVGLPKSSATFLVGVLSGVMSLGALFSAFYFRILERKRVFTVVGLLTPIALTLLLISNNFWVFFVSFVFLGFVSGFGYFFGLYYALADQERDSANVAVNEALTGVAALVIPFIVGYLASNFSYFIAFLFMMIISLICYSIAIYLMWQRKRTAIIKEKFDRLIEEADKKYKA